MGRAPAAFRQSDLTRALKAAKAAGERPRRVRIAPTGEIEMDFEEGAQVRPRSNDFDAEFG